MAYNSPPVNQLYRATRAAIHDQIKTYSRKSRSKRLGARRKTKLSYRQKNAKVVKTMTKRKKNGETIVCCPKDSTHTFRYSGLQSVQTTPPGINHKLIGKFKTTQIESLMSSLRFFDPTTGNVATRDMTTTRAYRSSYAIKRSTVKLSFWNTGKVPANFVVYRFKCISATESSPMDLYDATPATQGGMLAQISASSPVITQPSKSEMLYITDCNSVKHYWQLDQTTYKHLASGAMSSVSHSVYNIPFSEHDINAAASYDPAYKSFVYVIRLAPGVSYDKTNYVNTNIPPVVMTTKSVKTLVLEYDAGIGLNDFSTEEGGRDIIAAGNMVMRTTPSVTEATLN